MFAVNKKERKKERKEEETKMSIWKHYADP
jgi:hypothetical protein